MITERIKKQFGGRNARSDKNAAEAAAFAEKMRPIMAEFGALSAHKAAIALNERACLRRREAMVYTAGCPCAQAPLKASPALMNHAHLEHQRHRRRRGIDTASERAHARRGATGRRNIVRLPELLQPGEQRLKRRRPDASDERGRRPIRGRVPTRYLEGAMSGLTSAPTMRVHDPSGVATHGVALWSAGESPY
jgi:hypothetical protein